MIMLMGIMLIPFAGLGASAPQLTVISGLLIAAAFALVLLDAVLGYGSLDGISVELPDVIRLLKDRQGSIELRIKNEKMKSIRLRLGLALPQEILSPEEVRVAILPGESGFSCLSWICTAVRRGNYLLERCYLEGSSPLKFWAVRSIAHTHTEIRVYPNLMSERKDLAPIFLKHGNFGA